MDTDPEELQFIGFCGLYREACQILYTWREIFIQITIALILPLSLIFLAHIQISEFLFGNIVYNEEALDFTRTGSPMYNRISNRLSSEWTAFWVFKAVYLLFVLILSLLSTSAVVYTIASIYTAKELTFRKVLSVVPIVWKRLMITFLWNFGILLGYNIVAILVVVICMVTVGFGDAGLALVIPLAILYLIGFVYINVIWHLACVISVLEQVYGIQAMIKSKALIKGKMGLASAIYISIQLSMVIIQGVFEDGFTLGDSSSGTAIRATYGIVCFFLLVILILLGLVLQTIVYFICKSYHHQSIDKSSLSDHLEVYLLGEYVPLKGKDVQLEQFDI